MKRFIEEIYLEDEDENPDPRAPSRGCLVGLLIVYVVVLLALAAWRFAPG